MRYVKRTRIEVPAKDVFAFHERADALATLQPPWMHAQVIKAPRSLAVGTEVIVRTRIGPIPLTIVAEHVAYEPGRMFADRMKRGPFSRWMHKHTVEPDGAEACFLIDDVDYALPGGRIGEWLGGWLARRQLERMFAYRHEVTRRACEEE